MNLFDSIIKSIANLVSMRVYEVTVIVERDGILIGKKTFKKLMTYEKALKMVE